MTLYSAEDLLESAGIPLKGTNLQEILAPYLPGSLFLVNGNTSAEVGPPIVDHLDRIRKNGSSLASGLSGDLLWLELLGDIGIIRASRQNRMHTCSRDLFGLAGCYLDYLVEPGPSYSSTRIVGARKIPNLLSMQNIFESLRVRKVFYHKIK